MNRSPFILLALASIIFAGCNKLPPEEPTLVAKKPVAQDSGGGGTMGTSGSGSTTDPVKPEPQGGKKTPENPQTPTAPVEAGLTWRSKRPISERFYQLNDLEVVKLTVAGKDFYAWVMDTESKGAEGMMFIEDGDVKDDEAMIFVYAEEQQMGFWMKNTHIPLDIAFLNKDKTILNVATMKAFDETSTRSTGAAMYAVEFKAGVLKKHGIKAGMKISFSSNVKRKD
jgi:uncharacterized protein